MTRALHSLPQGLRFFERGWLSSNNVLLHSPQRSILIDTGYWTHADQTCALVSDALGEQALDEILCTHLHSDHCGGNARLQERFAAAITRVPPGHAAHVFNWDPASLTYEPTGQHCPQFVAHGLIQPGESFEIADMVWQVHAAPGHDPNSVIFFSPTHLLLISADALWENGFGVVFPELEGISAFDEVASTLDLIEDLNPLLVLPGHGAIFSDVPQSIARARSRLSNFVADPRKHGVYAAKVLLKFKLLELQRMPMNAFLAWAETTDYLRLLHRTYGNAQSMRTWLLSLCEDLVKANAAERDGEFIVNQ
jgi:glyoxylase-like metal-dependent hydrolase (beta-lactamase superfamily II)